MKTHKATKVAVKATAVVAVVVTAFSLAACSSGADDHPGIDPACAEMHDYAVPPGAQSIVAVFDPSESMRDGSWISPAFSSLVADAAGVYSTLSVLWVGGAGETPAWAINNLPLNDESFEFDTKHYNEAVERASSCVASMIGAPASTQPGTDLGTALQVASDRLAEAEGPKRLIVVSDGLSNAGPIDLTGVIATTAVDTVLSRLDAEGYRPNFAAAAVSFTGLGVTSGSVIDGATVTWLRNYWVAVCERAGAATCDTPIADQGASAEGTQPRAGAPEDPDLELPAVSFELSDAEVPFELDSASIPAAADEQLSQIAACLQGGSTLTVIGHADSTGADPAHNQSLSEGRAQAVAARILELAGNPAVTVTAFGVGSNEPKSATGDQPEDRRVEISLTGVCG